MKLRIGTIVGTGKPFLVDDQSLLETRLLVVANSGGGKSFLFRKCNEVLNPRIQCGLLDWKGEYASLREKFDFILCGGKSAEVRIEYHAARTWKKMSDAQLHAEEKLEEESRERTVALASLLLKSRDSFVIDLSSIVHKGDRLAFAGAFLDAIGANAPKNLWRPIFVWLDEVHLLCPEKQDTAAKDAVIDIMSLTRQRGAGGNAASQRLSKFDKDGEAECNNVLVGRTSLDADLRRSADLLGFGKDRWPDLKNLEPGQFFAFGPAFNTKEALLVQIDPVVTTHPRPGRIRTRVRLRKPTARIKKALTELRALPQVVAERVEEVETTKKELETLRTKIRTLEGELKMAKRLVEVEVEEKYIFRKGEAERLQKALDKAVKSSHVLAKKLFEKIDALEKDRDELLAKLAKDTEPLGKALVAVQKSLEQATGKQSEGLSGFGAAPSFAQGVKAGRTARKTDEIKASYTPTTPETPKTPTPLNESHQRVLAKIAEHHPYAVTVPQIAALAKFKVGRNLFDMLRKLRGDGVIHYDADKAIAYLVNNKHPRGVASTLGAAEFLAYWENAPGINASHAKVLEYLFRQGQTTVDQIAKDCNYTIGRNLYDILRHLRALKLITYDADTGAAGPSKYLLREET